MATSVVSMLEKALGCQLADKGKETKTSVTIKTGAAFSVKVNSK